MLNLFFFILLILFMAYAVLILYYRKSWMHLNEHKLNKSYTPKTKVSILIPARNEASNISTLLKNIRAQHYPNELMEVVVIDDHSTDATAEIVSTHKGVRCISLEQFTEGKKLNAYKKKAIEIGISETSGELIITTDADCTLCEYWLLSIVQFYETYHHHLIAAPVLFTSNGTWFQNFQSIDFFTMQGITGALAYTKSGTMCNGANLAYTRFAFNAVQGFKDIDDIASGDDMLLMYKIEKKFPKKTAYLKCKDAIIYTFPLNKWSDFLQQRIRWASKAKVFKDHRIKFVLSLVYVFNFMFPFLLLLSMFSYKCFIALLMYLLLKTGVELYFIIPVSNFFKKKQELKYFLLLQLIHIPYILLSGLKGQFGTYTWKDREVT